MKKIIVLFMLVMQCQIAIANELNEEEICKYNGSSMHDVECTFSRFKAVEAVLNTKYRELMSKLELTISREPERLKGLKAKYIVAQRAWVEFREKECSAFGVWYTNGTLQKSYYYNCMKSMAYKRIDEFSHFANPGK